MVDMSLNMFCKGQKATTESYRRNYENTFRNNDIKQENTEETKEENEDNKT
tara:strand:- start:1386 stop:1538 length:153 start_codon:yes stop_codon:yes gene_type:complete